MERIRKTLSVTAAPQQSLTTDYSDYASVVEALVSSAYLLVRCLRTSTATTTGR